MAKITDALVYLSSDKVCVEGLNPIKELETRLIEETRQYFRRQADQMVGSCDLAGYLKLADKILVDEKARFTTYLTWDKIE